jgi:predicted AlkP superfamily phosphohydrolase/phosphomutase
MRNEGEALGFLDKFKKKGDATDGKRGKSRKREKGSGGGRKVFVLSIDGTPFTFLEEMVKQGHMPNLGELVDGTDGCFRQMKSVLPTVSSVAWATFLTGRNPGKHGIFGFIDRKPDAYDIYLPNGRNLEGQTISEILSDAGKKVFSMNVPMSFPPRKVNGIMIGCFLCPEIEKISYPPDVSDELKKLGYIIDVDAWLARENLDKFMPELFKTLEMRAKAMFHFYERGKYDFFMTHIMETDRINHFVWEQFQDDDPKYGPLFQKFYTEIDDIIGKIQRTLKKDTDFILMSDHGFTTLKKEVYVNRWLQDQGYLVFKKDEPEGFRDLDPGKTRAYSMDPGRIYVNLEGREPGGVVMEGEEYESLRTELAKGLSGLKDGDGSRMVDKVVRKEDIYSGPLIDEAPDLIVVPIDGYDMKGALGKPELTFKGKLVGMHTYYDATMMIAGHSIKADDFSIVDAAPTIFKMMDVPVPDDMDGKSII